MNGIQHITPPPYHPATNGLAEVSVRTVKTHILRAMEERKSTDLFAALNRFLLHYRNTIHSSTGVTPAELLTGRKLRMRLDLILPEEQLKRQHLRKEKRGRDPRRLTRNSSGVKRNKVSARGNFKKGDRVFVRDYRRAKPSWVPAEIVEQNGPRNYKTLTNENFIWRRHSDQIIKGPSYDDDDLLDYYSRPLTVDSNANVNDVNDDVVEESAVGKASSPEPIREAETISDDFAVTNSKSMLRPTRNRKPPDWFANK
ncbi:uncharacterized protein K02A2.6-like [Photinus pyralis]|uniref:uncharacterized protein K02A2.6-like n=1 Tax=Photinus pyralis TaxID=7054 RepID=UPI0012670723|nr:uncharacterized protein K02A2.6-like [Photinus pyralis]